MGTLLICFSFSLCLFLFTILIKFFNKLWWTPIGLQSMMRSQGIKGPPYKFLHGSTKEIMNLRSRSMTSPMELSHELLPRVQPHFHSWFKLYGKIFLYWIGPKGHMVVTEPEMIKEVFNNREGGFPKRVPAEYMKKLVGDGIATTGDVEKWSKLRKLANHAFHGECLKNTIPAMTRSVETMLERWRQHGSREIDVFKEFKILTSEVISRAAFGSSYLEGLQIGDMLMRLSFIIARNHYKIRVPGLGKFIRTADDIESDELVEGIRNTIIGMIKEREEEALTGKSDGYGSDFLGLLLDAHHDADKTKRLTVEEMIDECRTVYNAGSETTATSLTWTVFLLAIHKDWQEKARQEVLELLGEQNPSSDSITRLKIVSMIVNETLRLYPPVVQLPRRVKMQVRSGKLILPTDLHIHVPILALHHDTDIWGEDADLFKPERFADGVAKATNNNSAAFFPFGMGPRICAGTNFALTEIKVALSMILQHYKFTLSPNYVHSPIHLLNMSPQHGLQIILQAL